MGDFPRKSAMWMDLKQDFFVGGSQIYGGKGPLAGHFRALAEDAKPSLVCSANCLFGFIHRSSFLPCFIPEVSCLSFASNQSLNQQLNAIKLAFPMQS